MNQEDDGVRAALQERFGRNEKEIERFFGCRDEAFGASVGDSGAWLIDMNGWAKSCWPSACIACRPAGSGP